LLFHSRTPFQNETRARGSTLFHREPRGSAVEPAGDVAAIFTGYFGDSRLAR